jgi:hypothetical protein
MLNDGYFIYVNAFQYIVVVQRLNQGSTDH